MFRGSAIATILALSACAKRETAETISISPERQPIAAAIVRHEVIAGMTALDVRLAWGVPRRITPGETVSGASEWWSYERGTVALRDGKVIAVSLH